MSAPNRRPDASRPNRTRDLPPRPGLRGRARGVVVLVLLAVGVLAFAQLGLTPAGIVPGEGGARIASDFFAAALTPATDYEAGFVPSGAPPFFARVATALVRTLLFAVAAMSLAVPAGLVLGFFASTRSWSGELATGSSTLAGLGRHRAAAAVQALTRLVIAGARSVHELLWAIVLLAAFGLTPAAAVIAIAIPYAGVLAKVFSELLDEAPDEAARALRASGASPVRAFLFGQLARAAPDMFAYAFYRFECAVRSSAVLGFFGFETLGYFLAASFDNLHYREVWTYLYALVALVVAFELWSSALRRRFVV